MATPLLSRRRLLTMGGVLGATLAYGGAAHLLLTDDGVEPNDSDWMSTVPAFDRIPRAPLQGTHTADLVIVGGGFTGLSAAWHAKVRHPDLRIVLLEARHLGFGASGRNGGQTVSGTANHVTMPGTGDNVRLIRDLTAAQGLAWDFAGRQGNPLRLVLELARIARAAGVEVHERTEVRRIDEGATARVIGQRFEIETPTVILATNAYTPRLGYLRRELAPIHTACLVTEPLVAIETLPEFWTRKIRDGTDYYWGRTLPDGRFFFGGGIRYQYGNGLTFPGAPALYRALEHAMVRLFPPTRGARVAYRWNGPMAFFHDLNPRLGRLGDHHNLLYGVGYAGMGLTMAVRFGQFLAAWLDDEAPPRWTLEPAVPIPGEPLRTMGINAAIHLVDLGWVRL